MEGEDNLYDEIITNNHDQTDDNDTEEEVTVSLINH